MPNVSDAENAFLTANATTQEWRNQFVADWFKPYTDLMVVQLWQNIDPMTHTQLKQMAPEAYAQVSDRVKAIQEGRNGETDR